MRAILNWMRRIVDGGAASDAMVGEWGQGIFENDDAGDWMWGLEEDGAGHVETAVEAVNAGVASGDGIPITVCRQGLAAAECVAYALGRPAVDLDEEHEAAMAANADAVRALPDIGKRTVRATIGILGQAPDGKPVRSELALRRENSGSDAEFQNFMAAVTDLTTRLKSALEPGSS